jgi:hypothetical protein
VLSATIITLQPVNVDKLGAFGAALAEWMEAAATICMVVLQKYYKVRDNFVSIWSHGTRIMRWSYLQQIRLHLLAIPMHVSASLMQENATTDSTVQPEGLQNGGFASDTEGKLQQAVLVLSILAVLANLIWIWGFVLLRILGLFYVRKQV